MAGMFERKSAREEYMDAQPDAKFQKAVSGRSPDYAYGTYNALSGEYRQKPGGVSKVGGLRRTIDKIYDYFFGGNQQKGGWSEADEAKDREAAARVRKREEELRAKGWYIK